MSNKDPEKVHPDYYFENGYLVFTEYFHLKRGVCCGSGCRHCPFDPKHTKGNKCVSKSVQKRYQP